MSMAEHNINMIPLSIRAFIQYHSAYEHKKYSYCFFTYSFIFGHKSKDNHLSTLTFVIHRLPVT